MTVGSWTARKIPKFVRLAFALGQGLGTKSAGVSSIVPVCGSGTVLLATLHRANHCDHSSAYSRSYSNICLRANWLQEPGMGQIHSSRASFSGSSSTTGFPSGGLVLLSATREAKDSFLSLHGTLLVPSTANAASC